MQTLDRRLADLERMSEKHRIDLVIHFVDAADDEIQFLTDRAGKDWTRGTDESEADFKGRALGEATRTDFGIVQLFSSN